MDYNEGKGLRQMRLGSILRRVSDAMMYAAQWAGSTAAAIPRRLFVPFIFIARLILYVPTNLFGPRASQFELYQLRKEAENLRKEKEDALNRLSQMVSVKLRDNNPNIVDLNDPYRPTKLAEMFSELYDNEWTSAYGALEDEHEGPQIVSFLLKIVMECYEFSKNEIDATWNYVEKWFLNDKLESYKQTKRALEDGRKLNVPNMSEQVTEKFAEYLQSKCDGSSLSACLSQKAVKSYIGKCTLLCLLMNACSPPVVMSYPKWRLPEGQENARGGDKRKPKKRHSLNGELENKVAGNGECVTKATDEHEGQQHVENDLFDRASFKEYTKRGKYVSFYVWPAMYLHQDGPLLCKGVAQGTPEQYSWERI